jgi:aryl-alcohol dehydrogenase-like predicted oxidoreductase
MDSTFEHPNFTLGRATQEGTSLYFQERRGSQTPRLLGKTGLLISGLGFGSYRVGTDNDSAREALTHALKLGINLIDTSTNYENGSAERLIGQVLAEYFESGEITRDQVVIISKAGYAQGDQLDLAQRRQEEGSPFPDMTVFSEDCWHCISPEWLREQLDGSLNRLKLQSLDGLLLHNPEYFLKAGGSHAEYYARIERAFEHLETEVDLGRISFYGVSSNTFPEANDSEDFTSLEVLLEISQKISQKRGKPSHFSVVQFPFNLFESGACFENNNSGKTLLELAERENLGTLINRPLNAFVGNKLIRLADFPAHSGVDTETDLNTAFEEALKVESEYPASAQTSVPPRRSCWAHILRKNISVIEDLLHWRQVLNFQILPQLKRAIHDLSELPGSDSPEYQDWLKRFELREFRLLSAISAWTESQTQLRSQFIASQLDSQAPDLKDSRTLSQKALRLYLSVPALHCVLLGMRTENYVKDGMQALRHEIRIPTEHVFDALDAVQEGVSHGLSEHSH